MPDHAKVSRLHFGKINEASHARRELFASIPAGTELKTILEPAYWAHHTRDLRPMDLIEAVCDDGSWEASLRVMFVAKTEARVSVRWKTEYAHSENTPKIPDSPYSVKWLNIGKKYAVVLTETQEVIEDKLFPEDEAHKALARHIKNLNR